MDLARRAHQSPGRLVDEDGLRGLPLAQRAGQGQSGVVTFLVWEFVRLQEPLHRRQRTACVLPVKSVTGLFVTLFSKSESRCRKKDAGSRLRCALGAVRGSLQNIPTLDRHFVSDVICKLISLYNELEEKRLKSFQRSASWCSYSWQSSSSLAGVLDGVLTNETWGHRRALTVMTCLKRV